MTGGTKRTIIVAMILGVSSIGLFGFMAHRVAGQGDRLVVQIAALQEQRAQEASHHNLRRIANESAEDRSLLRNYFLGRESDSIDFLNTVETLAPTVGVSLKTADLKLVSEKDIKQSRIEVTFEFSGDRLHVENFIEILETLPYVSRLQSVSLSAKTIANWEAVVTMHVQVLAYDE